MPLIYYRASLQGTTEGEDAVSFISSDTNKQPSLTNRSRSPSIKPAASEGTTSHKVNTESAVLVQALTSYITVHPDFQKVQSAKKPR